MAQGGPEAELPLGTSSWLFTCHSEEVDSANLNLFACGEREFTCRSGSCVPAAQRCNQQPGRRTQNS